MAETIDRARLIADLARDVTLRPEAPYEELEAALGALVDAVTAGKSPGISPDWPAVIGEALNLRPSH